MKILSFSQQLAAAFFIIAVSIGAMYFSINEQTVELTKTAQRVKELRIPTALASQTLTSGIHQSLAALRGWIILGDDEFRLERASAWLESISPALEELEQLSSTWTNPENIERLQTIRVDIQDFKVAQSRIERIAQTQEATPATKILVNEAAPIAENIAQLSTKLIELESLQRDSSGRKKILKDMADFRGSFALGLADIRLFVISGEPSIINKFESHWEIIQTSRETLELDSKLMTNSQLVTFKELLTALAAFEPLPAKMFAIRASDRHNLANYYLSTVAAPKAESILRSLRNMVQNQQNLLIDDFQSHENEISALVASSQKSTGLAIFMVVVLAIFITRTVSMFFKQTVDFINKIGDGSWGRGTEFEGTATMSLLGDALTSMKDQIDERAQIIEENSRTVRDIVNASKDSILSITNKGIILTCNSQTQQMFGFSELELIGQNINILMPEPHLSLHDGYLKKHLETGVKSDIWGGYRELIAKRKDGSLFPINLSLGTVKTKDGLIFTGFIRDITKQSESQKAVLLANENLTKQNTAREKIARVSELMQGATSLHAMSNSVLGALAEILHAGRGVIYLADTSHSDEHINILRLYGRYAIKESSKEYPKIVDFSEGLLGQCAQQQKMIILNEVSDSYLNAHSVLGESKTISIILLPFLYESKLIGVIELATFKPVPSEDFETIKVIMNNLAVSVNTLQILERTQELLAEMESQSEALHLSNEDLEKSSQFKSDFLATMSHEIRTPMNGVLGMLDLLLKTELSTDQIRKSKMAKNSALSLLSIINDILDFSKVEAGKLELDIIDFDIRTLLCEFTETISASAHEKGLHITLDVIGIEESLVKGDSNRILQIMNNIVGNAIKFTDAGEIIIRAELQKQADDRRIMSTTIQDTGIGISKEKEKHLFEAFHQLDASTTRKYGGTGLGLSIVKNLCHLMGGEISYNSPTEGGSCFTFTLLLEPSQKSKPIKPNIDLTSLNILVVDSHPTGRQTLFKQFEHWGANVLSASDAKQAMQHFLKRKDSISEMFDAVFIDETLSDATAVNLFKNAMAATKNSNTKFFVMVDFATADSGINYKEIGFAGSLGKPASFSDLFDSLMLVVNPKHARTTPLPSAHPQLTGDSSDIVANSTNNSDARNQNKRAKDKRLSADTRLLLVEDNFINQQIVLGILEDLELSVDIANDGEEALKAIEEQDTDTPYDLIMMDCQMPVMDGLTCTRTIRDLNDDHSHKNVPILAMTANAMQGDKEKCLEAGMTDYLAKPIDGEVLIETLQRMLNHQKPRTTKNQSIVDR
ncbi:MAG: response regulator [Kangiellaceae bacterium]|nr:response regulator [Kangiellaceae bacterium]